MADSEWLQGLKAGDEVAVHNFEIHTYTARAVQAATDDMVFVGGWRYRRDTGRPWNAVPPLRLVEPSTAPRNAVLASRLAMTNWRDLSLATLERVAAALEANDER